MSTYLKAPGLRRRVRRLCARSARLRGGGRPEQAASCDDKNLQCSDAAATTFEFRRSDGERDVMTVPQHGAGDGATRQVMPSRE